MREGNTRNSHYRTGSHTLLLSFSALAAALFIGGCLADSMDAPEGISNGEGGGGGNGNGSTETYGISGDITGLDSEPVILDLNGNETLTLDSNDAFVFQTEVADGENYTITVDTHPSETYCGISNGSGTVNGSDISDVQVACEGLSLSSFTMSREAVALSWDRQGAVDIRFSTDPDCDWTNVTLCDNGGSVADITGGQTTVTTDDGLLPDKGYSFVQAIDHAHSAPVIATAARYSLSGPVHDTLVHDGKVYAGGEFRTFGPTAGGMASFRIDRSEALQTGFIPATGHSSDTPAVYNIAEDPNGGWFIVGTFEEVDGVPRSAIARLNANGALDTTWQANIDGNWIAGLIVHDGRLYIGGSFNAVDGNSNHPNLAALDLDGNLDTSFAPGGTDRVVQKLLHENDRLYVVGRFKALAGETVDHVAALDLSDGSLISSFDAGTDHSVYAAHIADGLLFLGGTFNEVNGTARSSLAAVDLEDGSLASQPNLAFGSSVWAVTVDDDSIYVGGSFLSVDSTTRERMATIDRASGELRSDWTADTNGTVYGLSLIGGQLYVSGRFTEISGQRRHFLSRMNPATAELDPDWTPALDGESMTNVWAVIEHGNEVRALGRFHSAGGHAVDNLAALELDSGELVSSWHAGTDGPVHALGADADTLYVGGSFDTAFADGNRQPRSNASAFDLNSGQDRGWAPEPSNSVWGLALNDAQDTVFLGGDFTTIKAADRQRIAAVDTAKGDPYPTGDAEVNRRVRSVQYYGAANIVVFGGDFTQVNGNAAYARYHSLDASDFSTNFANTDVNDRVRSVWVDSHNADNLFIGGDFSQVNGDAHTHFAWNSGGTSVEPGSPEADGAVHAINHLNTENRLLVGGEFTQIAGSTRDRFALFDFDGTNITLQSSPSFDDTVRTVKQTSNYLIVGGDFTNVGSELQRHLVVLDAQTLDNVWSANAMESLSNPRVIESPASSDTTVNDGAEYAHPGILANND